MLVVQYGGDYREAYNRLAAGGEETYYAQRYSVSAIGEIGRTVGQIGVLCCYSNTTYDEVVGNGVRALGAGLTDPRADFGTVLALMERFGPTHLVVTTPRIELLRWALTRQGDVLPRFADTFYEPGTPGLPFSRCLARALRRRQYRRRLVALLNDRRVRWVANHNVNASQQLVDLGVDARKVVPWDWPPIYRPDMFEPKGPSPEGRPWRLAYAGAVAESKGLGDAVEAVAALRRRGRDAELRVFGPGDAGPFVTQAESLGLAGAVRFEGQRPHPEVIQAMRAADVVVVPSRHEYPEGIPMVIYEALAVRTPLVCSDHPAFRGRIGEGSATLTFPERGPTALADAVERIMTDPLLYARMSQATATVHDHLQCPVKYGELIRRWLAGTPEDQRWLAGHSLYSVEKSPHVASQ